MPPVVAAIAGVLVGIGVAYSTAVVLSYLIVWTLTVALSMALSAAAQAIMQAQMRVTAGQQNIQQTIPFRRRGYGRMKLGGYFVFIDHNKGDLYTVLAILSHQIDAIEQYWVGDRQVVLDPDNPGRVQKVVYPPAANPHQFYVGYEAIEIHTQLGDSSKTFYAGLNAIFGDAWDDTCIGYGVADVFMIQYGVKEKYFATVYPGGPQPYRQVCRGALIRDPRTLLSPGESWSENAIAVIADYLTHADGWRLDDSFIYAGKALPITQAAADVCDELVDLKSGGTEKRYRIWGFYDFDEQPRSVLMRMLVACGGWLQPQTDGTIAIKAGAFEEPTVTLTSENILGYEIQHYPGEFDSINEVRANFTDPLNDYQLSESYPWENTADIARRGYRKTATLDARHCPSFTQTRRVQKISSFEVSPEWIATLHMNAYGLMARGQRFVNLDMLDELGLNVACRVTSFVADLVTGECTIGLSSFTAEAYGWDPETEEGHAPPTAPDTSQPTDVPPEPTGLVVTVVYSTISGGTMGGQFNMVVDAPDDASLTPHFQYAIEGVSPTVWIDIPNNGDWSAQSGIVPNGTYDAQCFFTRGTSRDSEPLIVFGVVVNAATVAPGSPTAFTTSTVSPSVDVFLSANSGNSSTVTAVRFWRNSTNTFATAADLYGAIFCSPNQVITKTDAPGSGTWYYWATAENNAAPPQASAPAGPQVAEI